MIPVVKWVHFAICYFGFMFDLRTAVPTSVVLLRWFAVCIPHCRYGASMALLSLT